MVALPYYDGDNQLEPAQIDRSGCSTDWERRKNGDDGQVSSQHRECLYSVFRNNLMGGMTGVSIWVTC